MMNAVNERYLAYMATIDNPGTGLRDIDKMSGRAKDQGRSFRGFNLFLEQDYRLFLTLGRGECSISDFLAGDLPASRGGLLHPSIFEPLTPLYPCRGYTHGHGQSRDNTRLPEYSILDLLD